MIEKYIQLSKEKNKINKLYLKQEDVKVNKFFFFSTLFLLFGMVSAFLFNLNFAFNIYDYNTFLEANGIQNILISLKTPSVFNGDFSILHDERTSFIIQEKLFVSNVNTILITSLFLIHFFMFFKSRSINKHKRAEIYNTLEWNAQSIFVLMTSILLILHILLPLNFIAELISFTELSYLPTTEYDTVIEVYSAVRTFELAYGAVFFWFPLLISIYAKSIFHKLKNINKYKSLNKEIQNEHLKEELKKYNEKINDIQTKIVKSNLLKKEILIKIEKTKDKYEYSILMDLIEFDIKDISKDEQKIKLFTKNNHETNNIENI